MKEARINRSKSLRSSRGWKIGVVSMLIFSILLSLLCGLGFIWMEQENYYQFSNPHHFSLKLDDVPFKLTATPTYTIDLSVGYIAENLTVIRKNDVNPKGGTFLCELEADGETLEVYLNDNFYNIDTEDVNLSLATSDGKRIYWNNPEEPQNVNSRKIMLGFSREGEICTSVSGYAEPAEPFLYEDFDYIFITHEELLDYADKNCRHLLRYEYSPGLGEHTLERLGLGEQKEETAAGEETVSAADAPEAVSSADSTAMNVTTTANVTTAADILNPTHVTTVTAAPAQNNISISAPEVEIYDSKEAYCEAQQLSGEGIPENPLRYEEWPYDIDGFIDNAAVLVLEYKGNDIRYVNAEEALSDYAWAVCGSNYYNYSYDKDLGVYHISVLSNEMVEPIAYLDFKADLADEENFTSHMKWVKSLYDALYPMRIAIIAIGALSVIAAIACFILMLRFAGWKKGFDTPQLRMVDKIPLEISLGLYALAGGVVYELVDYEMTLWWLIMAALFIPVLMTVTRRIKTRTIFKNLLCVHIFRYAKKFFRVLPTIWQGIVIGAAYGIFTFICIFAARDGNSAAMVVWCLISLILFLVAFIFCRQLGDIFLTAQNIAGGSSDEKIDTEKLFSPLSRHAENINSMSESVSAAVEERLRSERMKTDLIANVSHDIKTPLTSVINYIDLLKRTDITDPTAKEYLFVLERQSTRLKRLLDDIVEASKASSGCINTEIKPLNLRELLNQSVTEYSDKLADSGITPVVNISEDCTFALADGRLLWRVFDNLLSNICKYSQTGTRAYIEAVRMGNFAEISFRSISAEQLNISAEQLMERFVRGDRSRHTEGSGLGLSIARSLVELQNGQLNLSIDGDLFRAAVLLPIYEQPEEEQPAPIADCAEPTEIPEQPTLSELAAQCERFSQLEAADTAEMPELPEHIEGIVKSEE